jgi:hypothetical protein
MNIVDENNDAIQSAHDGIDANIYQGIRDTLAGARTKAFTAINFAMVEAYWEIGRQIEDAVGERAEYGKGLLKYLSEKLTEEFGKGFTERNLQAMRQFHRAFKIPHTLCAELSWSHYRLLMKIEDESRREFYTRECVEAAWSVRQLERERELIERQKALENEGGE